MDKNTLKNIIDKSLFRLWHIQHYEIDEIKDEGYAVQFTFKGGNAYDVHGAHVEICNKGAFRGNYQLFIHDDAGGIGDAFIKYLLKLMEDIKDVYHNEAIREKIQKNNKKAGVNNLFKNAIDKSALRRAMSNEKSRGEIMAVIAKIKY